MAVTYEVLLYDRANQQSTSPVFTLKGPIPTFERIGWGTDLLGDGYISVSCDPKRLPDAVKTQLADPYANASELEVLRDGIVVQRGPLIGIQAQGDDNTITLLARGLEYYVRYMFVTTDLIYGSPGTDQWTIAKALVDHWQAKDYGDFGIDTTSVGTSGTLREMKFYRDETPNIYEALQEMAQLDNGFDWFILPETRQFKVVGARGIDKSGFVILDSRGITSPRVYLSVAAEDVGNHAIAVGSDPDNGTLFYATATDETAAGAGAYGRVGVVAHIRGISIQATADDYAQALLNSANGFRFFPGGQDALGGTRADIFAVRGATPDDFDVGDKITWTYDFGIGEFTVAKDVIRKNVSVGVDGVETLNVEFH